MRQVLRHIARFAAATLMAALFSVVSHAQEAPITLKIYNSADGNKPFDDVNVFIFGTEKEGERAYNQWISLKKSSGDNLDLFFEPDGYVAHLDLAGHGANYQTADDYSLRGSILVITNASPLTESFIRLKGKSEISVYLEVVNTLDEAVVTGKGKARTKRQPPEDMGDSLDLKFLSYIFPEELRLGRSDGRFVMQSFLAPIPDDYDDRDEGAESTITDTLEWRKVIVMDGLDYHKTQYRRMGYLPLDQMGEADTLYVIAQNTPILTEETKEAGFYDKLYKSQQVKDGVLVMGQIWFEDYNHGYHEELVELSDTRRTSKPMQFLEYDSTPQELNPNEEYYIKTPKREPHEGMIDLNIQFEQGSARVNPNDAYSVYMLDSLRREIYNITKMKGSWLRSYNISGVSSPEGGYATNTTLADQRMRYIQSEIEAQIPANKKDGLQKENIVVKSRVASWSELADIIALEGYINEADQIRAIVAAHPGNNDAQNPFIYKLPFYDTIIKNSLPKLRVVKVEWKQEIFRKKTNEEVLADYYSNPTSKDITDYELWVLMQNLTKPEELEPVCQLAIENDSWHKPKERWLLPANVLASSYLKRGVVDTTILAPFIDDTYRCDFPWNPYGTAKGKPHFLVNPHELIINQILMMLKGEYYGRAADLAEMINTPAVLGLDPKYEFLYAVVRCKAGYWRTQEQYFNVLHDSTPRNAVIMDMAAGFFDLANYGLEDLDQDDPLTMYLKAQLPCRKFYDNTERSDFNLMSEKVQDDAIRILSKCFTADKKYLEIAKRDWFIFKDLLKKAKKEYENPGSVLRPESVDTGMSDAEKAALLRKGANHFDELTEEEQAIYLDLISQ